MSWGELRAAVMCAVGATALAMGAAAAAQTYSEGYQFLEAVKESDLTKVEELLSKPGSTVINSRDLTSGRSGLHIAVERRDLPWVNLLTKRGVNPNIADVRGVTALMRASQIGFVDGVQSLLAAGARVDDSNDAGETPLILAVHRRDTAMMRLLLQAGADPDRNDNSGRSARDYAELEGRNGVTLAEIERSALSGRARAASRDVYGPSL